MSIGHCSCFKDDAGVENAWKVVSGEFTGNGMFASYWTIYEVMLSLISVIRFYGAALLTACWWARRRKEDPEWIHVTPDRQHLWSEVWTQSGWITVFRGGSIWEDQEKGPLQIWKQDGFLLAFPSGCLSPATGGTYSASQDGKLSEGPLSPPHFPACCLSHTLSAAFLKI